MTNDLSAALRVAVVGYGYWGPQLVRNAASIPRMELTYICDQDPDALQRAQIAHRHVETTPSFATLINDPNTDAIVICTPVATHFQLAQAALRAGKHVFVEKPLASSVELAEQLKEEAEAAGRLIMPGHTFLYSPAVTAIREIIDSGALGEILFVSMSRVNLGIHQPDASVIWDLGPHDVSILHYWLDETPLRVSTMSRGCIFPGTPDVAFVHLEMPSGVLAHLELSWLAPSKLRRTAIVGRERMIVYDDTSSEPVRIFNSGADLPDPDQFGDSRLHYRTGSIVSPHVPVHEPLRAELEDFADCALDGTKPRSSVDLGIEVVRVLEMIEHSLNANYSPVA